MKQFIALTWQKAVLTLFVVVFAPLPFFAILVMGFAPPVYILLLGLVWMVYSPGAGIILLFIFLLYALCLYMVTCVVVSFLEGIAEKPYIQWAVIVIVSALLFYGSFHRIYRWGNMGGAHGPYNFLELVIDLGT